MGQPMGYFQIPGLTGAGTGVHAGWVPFTNYGDMHLEVIEADGSMRSFGVWVEVVDGVDDKLEQLERMGQPVSVVCDYVNAAGQVEERRTMQLARISLGNSIPKYPGSDKPEEKHQRRAVRVSFYSEQAATRELFGDRKPLPPSEPRRKPSPPAPANPSATGLKQAVLHIRVVDENGNERVPKGGDAVLVQVNQEDSPRKLKYESEKGFVHPLVEGKGTLTVLVQYASWIDSRAPHFTELRQEFAFDAPAKAPTLKPFWPGKQGDVRGDGQVAIDPDRPAQRDGYLLACMSLNRAAGGHDQLRSPKVFHLTVTLHPLRIYVAVAGCNFWQIPRDGDPVLTRRMEFDRYAAAFAEHLVATGRLNASSPFLMYDCPRGLMVRWDRVKSELGGTAQWKRHRILVSANPVPAWPDAKAFSAWQRDMHYVELQPFKAQQIYELVSELGRQLPGSVVDFSIFSHSAPWTAIDITDKAAGPAVRGPLLYNAAPPPYDERELSRKRNEEARPHPQELDPHLTRDWEFPFWYWWSILPRTMAADGTVHIWGGFPNEVFAKMLRFLLGEGGTNGRFVSKTPKLDLDRSGVVAALKTAIHGRSYMSNLARVLSRNVFGGLPGFEAEAGDLTAVRNGQSRGSILQLPQILKDARVRKLLESPELGSLQFNEFGYRLYRPKDPIL